MHPMVMETLAHVDHMCRMDTFRACGVVAQSVVSQTDKDTTRMWQAMPRGLMVKLQINGICIKESLFTTRLYQVIL